MARSPAPHLPVAPIPVRYQLLLWAYVAAGLLVSFLAAGSHPASCRGASDTRGSLLDLDGRGGVEAEAHAAPTVLFRARPARVGGWV